VPARFLEGYLLLGMSNQGNHRGLPLRVRAALSAQTGIARKPAQTPGVPRGSVSAHILACAWQRQAAAWRWWTSPLRMPMKVPRLCAIVKACGLDAAAGRLLPHLGNRTTVRLLRSARNDISCLVYVIASSAASLPARRRGKQSPPSWSRNLRNMVLCAPSGGAYRGRSRRCQMNPPATTATRSVPASTAMSPRGQPTQTLGPLT